MNDGFTTLPHNVTQLRRPVHGSSFHYKDFLISKAGYDGAFENPHGFILYKQITPTEMRIGEIYIEPKIRNMGLARELANQVTELAISKGCTHLSCMTHLTGNDDHLSMLAILHYGFKPVAANGNEIFFVKEITQ
jgi:GNAT superfamily N-acetyltransferase